jgi:hypothetical protein
MIGNLNTIRSEGYRALTRELGAAGAAQFLRQMENGRGNYTEDRRRMLDENSVDDIVQRIQERK